MKHKLLFRRLFALLLLCTVSALSWASDITYDFKVDGIYYAQGGTVKANIDAAATRK